MADGENVRENCYRRVAEHLGLLLMKSRAKKWSVDDHQGYRIVDLRTGRIVAGEKFGMSLEEVAKYLKED